MIRIIILLSFFLLNGSEKESTSDYRRLSGINDIKLNRGTSDTVNDILSFKTYTGKHLIISYSSVDSNAILLIENVFNPDYDKLCKIFDNYPSQKIAVKVYHKMNILLKEEHIYGYIAGIVTGENNMSIVSPLGYDIYNHPMNKLEQLKVIPHEFIHTQIHKINFNTVTWLNEGSAYYFADQGSFFKNSDNFNDVLRKIRENKVPSISDLEQGYNSFFKVENSLTFSYLMVEFLESEYGKNSILGLIKTNCDFEKVIGISKTYFYSLWIEYLRRTYKNKE